MFIRLHQPPFAFTLVHSNEPTIGIGNGLHSYRLAEAIFLGAIPVIVDAKLILPFCQVLDWRRFSVRVPPSAIPQLPQLLRRIPPAELVVNVIRYSH